MRGLSSLPSLGARPRAAQAPRASSALAATAPAVRGEYTVPYNTGPILVKELNSVTQLLGTGLLGRLPGPPNLPNGGLGGKWEVRPVLLGYSDINPSMLAWDDGLKRYVYKPDPRRQVPLNPTPNESSKYPLYSPNGQVFYTPPPMETLFNHVTLFGYNSATGQTGATAQINFVSGPAYSPYPPEPPPPTPSEMMLRFGLPEPANPQEKLSYLANAVQDVLKQMMENSRTANMSLKYFLGEAMCESLAQLHALGLAQEFAEPFKSWAEALYKEAAAGVPGRHLGKTPGALARPTAEQIADPRIFSTDPGFLTEPMNVFETPTYPSRAEKTKYMYYMERETGSDLSPRYLFNDPAKQNPHALIQQFSDVRLTWAEMLPQVRRSAEQARDFLFSHGFKNLGKSFPSFAAYFQSRPDLLSYYQKGLSGGLGFQWLKDQTVELGRWKLGEIYLVVQQTPCAVWDMSNLSEPLGIFYTMETVHEKVPQAGFSLIEAIGIALLLVGVGALTGGAAAAVVAALGPAIVATTAAVGAVAGGAMGLAFGQLEYHTSGDLDKALQASAIAGGITGAVVGAVANVAQVSGGLEALATKTVTKTVATVAGSVAATGTAVLTGKIKEAILGKPDDPAPEPVEGPTASYQEEPRPGLSKEGAMALGLLALGFFLNNKK